MTSLVVYYSRTGNTRYIARQIKNFLEADIEEIIDRTDRAGKFGFIKSAIEAMVEGETEIDFPKCSPSDYDLVFLGCPVWARKLPPAMRTYIKRVDLSENKVAFFNTNESDETQNTFSAMKKLTSNQTPVGKLVVSDVSKDKERAAKKTEEWCKVINEKLEK